MALERENAEEITDYVKPDEEGMEKVSVRYTVRIEIRSCL
jgi:hypothetical protein